MTLIISQSAYNVIYSRYRVADRLCCGARVVECAPTSILFCSAFRDVFFFSFCLLWCLIQMVVMANSDVTSSLFIKPLLRTILVLVLKSLFCVTLILISLGDILIM
jgi:hypothetical protein